jgi:peptidyl-prolyl cis-trans isomerase SurA
VKKLRFALFGALVFISPLFLSNQSAQAAVLDRVVAVVGDEPILLSEVYALKAEIAKTPALAQAYRIDSPHPSNDMILDRMIEDRIIKQTAKQLDVSVSDAEVDNQIAAIAKQNNISVSQLESSLKGEGISVETYKRNIRSQLERRNVFDHELRKGGGVSEAELRDLYDKTAEVEVKLSVLAAKNNAQGRKFLSSIATQVNSGKLNIKDAIEKNKADSLDWIAPSQLNPKAMKLVQSSQPGKAVGPFEVDGTLQLLFYQDNRKGSREGFEKAKNELMLQAQAQDFERRFAFWLEHKKKDMNIVINKI